MRAALARCTPIAKQSWTVTCDGHTLNSSTAHPTIYPVDADGDFPYIRVRNYAKANGRAKDFEALEASGAGNAKALDELLQSHTRSSNRSVQ